MNTLDKTVINLKVSKSLKREAQELADEIGVPLTTVMTVGLKEFVRSRSLTISAFPQLKPAIEDEIRLAITDYHQGKNVSPTFTTARDVRAHLQAL